jgi:hypothetical protein
MATMPMDNAADMAAPDMAAPDMAAPEMMMGDEQGYVIEIIVKSDGTFAVSKQALQQEAMEPSGEEPADSFDSLGAAMKAVMDIVKSNPVGESAQAQFEAGYSE